MIRFRYQRITILIIFNIVITVRSYYYSVVSLSDLYHHQVSSNHHGDGNYYHHYSFERRTRRLQQQRSTSTTTNVLKGGRRTNSRRRTLMIPMKMVMMKRILRSRSSNSAYGIDTRLDDDNVINDFSIILTIQYGGGGDGVDDCNNFSDTVSTNHQYEKDILIPGSSDSNSIDQLVEYNNIHSKDLSQKQGILLILRQYMNRMILKILLILRYAFIAIIIRIGIVSLIRIILLVLYCYNNNNCDIIQKQLYDDSIIRMDDIIIHSITFYFPLYCIIIFISFIIKSLIVS